MLVHQLIHQGRSDDIFVHGPADVTYSQLKRAVECYRDYLYHAGVRSGENVGVLIRNSPAFVYAYMAIASLGAVVVPINYQLTAREVAYIVTDAGMRHLVTTGRIELEAELKSYGYLPEVTQHFCAGIEAYSSTEGPVAPPLDATISENQPCTIIYTSGTTGNPKGAVLTHRNLVSDADCYSRAMPVYAKDNILCILPLYHCLAWTCIILCALQHKASVTILDTVVPKEVVEAIKRYGVTVMYGVPSVYMLLLKNAEAGDLAGMRLLMSGGAPLPQQVAEDFERKFGIEITEGYGLSEAAPVVATNPQYRGKHLSIGLPVPGVETRIFSPREEELPPGEVGELVVRGPNVMKGYYNLPEETARALRGGWLHTGDMAYRDEDGYLFIVDRLKDMIITHGENIYPREIEEVLYTFPGVREAAVIGVSEGLRGQAACAYVVLKEGQALAKRELKDFLRGKLAPYKIPRDFIQVDSLPKNQAGKIMKRLLREERQRQ
ncbi:MAG: long-chain-fatty-acid--CoA ligase [Negativicutes bacterium]|nr:long-chain-fatty-acid--CoA ligase [Negativicutes bacterium]